jgi:PAS domain S-box-containing protein
MPGSRAVSWIMLCISIWSFFGAFEISVQEQVWKTFFSKIQYIGIVGVSPFWLLFVIDFTGLKHKIICTATKLALGIVPFIILLLVFTNEFHHLIWTSLTLETTTWGILQVYHHGIGVYAHMFYAYPLLLIGTILLFRYMFSSGKYKKQQIFLVLIAALGPWIINAIYLLKPNIFLGIEPSPIAFTLTGILLSISIFKYQLFELIPLAKEVLFTTIDIGFIILDKDNLIIEANPAAKKILDTNLLMGLNIKNVLNSYPKDLLEILNQDFSKKELLLSNLEPEKWVEFTLHWINNNENAKESGKLLILHDMSKRKEYEKSILETKTNLSVVIENTDDIIVYIDTEQKLLLFNDSYKKLIKNIYNVDVAPGMSAIDFLPPEDKDWWSANNQSGLNGDRFVMEFNKIINGETKYFETSFHPIIIEGVLTGISEFTRDITKRKITETELGKKVKELEQINRVMIGRELKMIELKKELKQSVLP